MLAGLKTQWSQTVERPHPDWKYTPGFFAEQLQRTLDQLPVHLWREQRRKRSYINAVLARAEVSSDYSPARKLWVRRKNGYYLPNPELLLRKANGWQDLEAALNIRWVQQGSGRLGLSTWPDQSAEADSTPAKPQA